MIFQVSFTDGFTVLIMVILPNYQTPDARSIIPPSSFGETDKLAAVNTSS